MNEQDADALEAMVRYGGSFVQALAQAAMRADLENYDRLKRAFPEVWRHYAVLAEAATKRTRAVRPEDLKEI